MIHFVPFSTRQLEITTNFVRHDIYVPARGSGESKASYVLRLKHTVPGITRDIIISHAKISPHTYSEIIKNFNHNGVVIDDVGKGRPKMMTEEIRTFIVGKTLEVASLCDAKLSSLIHQELNIMISRATINKYRHNLNFYFKSPKQNSFSHQNKRRNEESFLRQ